MPTISLPLGTTAEIRGMTGRDEDLLLNPKKARSGEAVDDILSNCTLKLTFPDGRVVSPVQAGDVKRLKSPDRLALLIGVRRESFGDALVAELTDPQTGEKFNATVDLATLEEKPAPFNADGGVIDQGPYDITLSNGKRLSVDFLDGKKELLLAKADPASVLTSAMYHRIVEVEGVHKNDIRNWLLDLPVRERNELREKLAALDCGPVTAVTADAPSGVEVQFDIQEQRSFFFPTT